MVHGHIFGRLYQIKKGKRIQKDHRVIIEMDRDKDECKATDWIIGDQLSDHIHAQFDTLPYDYWCQVEFGGDGCDGFVMQSFGTDKTFDFDIPDFRTTIYGRTWEITFGSAEWADDEEEEEDDEEERIELLRDQMMDS